MDLRRPATDEVMATVGASTNRPTVRLRPPTHEDWDPLSPADGSTQPSAFTITPSIARALLSEDSLSVSDEPDARESLGQDGLDTELLDELFALWDDSVLL